MSFDTHFHLDLVENPEKMVLSIEQNKIYTIAVTNLPGVFANTERLCKGCKYVKPALGYHPELVFKYNDQFQLFLSLIDKTRYIGEIGLDNLNKSAVDFNMQKNVFEKIISICAEKKDKVLTVHSRRAENEIISIIGNSFPGKVILHWYSGSTIELERGLNYGFYYSINSAMIKSKNGINIIKRIPNDRLLIESDGPFIEHNNNKSSPFTSNLIVEELSIIKNIPSLEMNKILMINFANLLSQERSSL
jgi:TatD DNase family protein